MNVEHKLVFPAYIGGCAEAHGYDRNKFAKRANAAHPYEGPIVQRRQVTEEEFVPVY